MADFIKNIDFQMLYHQKMALHALSENPIISEESREACEGIICLITAVQDYAVDEMGMDENTVYYHRTIYAKSGSRD